MRKKKIIISIVVVICVLVGVFFIMRFGVIGKIRNAINKPVVENKAEADKEEAPEEVRYTTAYDKEGNEIVIETKKIIVEDKEGNKFEAWLPTSPPITIYHHMYKGKIEKIEDNKIYFTVDKERKEGTLFFKNVKDYQIIFDIDTYDLVDSRVECRSGDSLSYDEGGLEDPWGDIKYFYSAEELEFLIGKYLGLQDYMCEDSHTGDRYKVINFYKPSLF